MSSGLEPRTYFSGLLSSLYNLLFKWKDFGPGTFFYHALFPSFGIHPFRDANPGQPLGVVVSVSVIFSSKQRWSWRLSFVMLSFQPTRTGLIGIRTKGKFSGFWPYWNFLLASGNKHFNFGENGFIRSWAKGNIHTYPQFQPCIGL
jgi:hypothetical protein